MDDELKKILIRVLSIPLGLVVAIIVLSIKKMSLKEHFSLNITPLKVSLLYFAGYIPVFLLNEFIYFGINPSEKSLWEYALPVMIVRAIGIIIFAPIAEELIFRGLLFKVISDRKPGPMGAWFLTTLFFTLVHFQYGFLDLLTIFIGALYWGWVRYKTGSTFLPILMHMFANTFSVIEFIWINKMV